MFRVLSCSTLLAALGLLLSGGCPKPNEPTPETPPPLSLVITVQVFTQDDGASVVEVNPSGSQPEDGQVVVEVTTAGGFTKMAQGLVRDGVIPIGDVPEGMVDLLVTLTSGDQRQVVSLTLELKAPEAEPDGGETPDPPIVNVDVSVDFTVNVDGGATQPSPTPTPVPRPPTTQPSSSCNNAGSLGKFKVNEGPDQETDDQDLVDRLLQAQWSNGLLLTDPAGAPPGATFKTFRWEAFKATSGFVRLEPIGDPIETDVPTVTLRLPRDYAVIDLTIEWVNQCGRQKVTKTARYSLP